MDCSETACRYCGVSYLVFHEFHQLRTQLAQTEAKLLEEREVAQREKAQRKALQLDRLEWERALRLQVQEETEVREKHTREELDERNRDTVRALKVEFEAKFESQRSKEAKEFQKICEERESLLRRELGDLAAKKLENQREELERKAGERESKALQKANKNLEDLRKNLQQLEERLEKTAATKEDAERGLGKEKQHVKTLRGACVRQQQALRATLSFLKFSGRELADVQGFLSQLKGTWQALGCQLLQQITQVFSVLNEELQHSTVKLQKMKEEKEHLTRQLIEQKGQRAEQMSQQETSEKEHRKNVIRLKGELEEKNERWLLCQQRCDAMQKQLSSWEQREKQLNQEYCAAVQEVTQMRKALELIQEEKEGLTTERDVLIKSHGEAMAKMEEDYKQQHAMKMAAALEEHRSQSAFHQKEQREELHRELELKLEKEREKNKMLLLKRQQENLQLQQKLEEKEQEVHNLHERWSMVEERRKQDKERKRREKEIQQQEAQKLSQAEAELELMTVKNAELMEEVALLQETVKRECEEREELTAALSRAQRELFEKQSAPSNRESSRPPSDLMKKRTPPGNNSFHLHTHTREPLTRSSTSPNRLWPSSACTDKDRALDTEETRRSLESCSSDAVFGGEKRGKGTLPRLRARHKISLVKGKK